MYHVHVGVCVVDLLAMVLVGTLRYGLSVTVLLLKAEVVHLAEVGKRLSAVERVVRKAVCHGDAGRCP